MSHTQGSTLWVWGEEKRMYRYHDANNQQWIYSDGSTVPDSSITDGLEQRSSHSSGSGGSSIPRTYPSGYDESLIISGHAQYDEVVDDMSNNFTRLNTNDTSGQHLANEGSGGGNYPHHRVVHNQADSHRSYPKKHRTGSEELKLNGKIFKMQHKSFFKPGTVSMYNVSQIFSLLSHHHVFQCILNQEAGNLPDLDKATEVPRFKNRHGQDIYTEIRMFVVMRDNEDLSSTCLSVQTYGGKGVAKSTVKKANHAVLYSGESPPAIMSREYPDDVGEQGMRKAIKVDVTSQMFRLDPKSRINLRALHTCQHNWKVHKVGTIHPKFWTTLWEEHYAALADSNSAEPSLSTSTDPTAWYQHTSPEQGESSYAATSTADTQASSYTSDYTYATPATYAQYDEYF